MVAGLRPPISLVLNPTALPSCETRGPASTAARSPSAITASATTTAAPGAKLAVRPRVSRSGQEARDPRPPLHGASADHGKSSRWEQFQAADHTHGGLLRLSGAMFCAGLDTSRLVRRGHYCAWKRSKTISRGFFLAGGGAALAAWLGVRATSRPRVPGSGSSDPSMNLEGAFNVSGPCEETNGGAGVTTP